MLNKVTLIGRLGKDPEARVLESGSKLVRLTIATNENYKDQKGEWQQKTEWHDLVFWRLLAERAEKSLGKGDLVYIEGKLRHRSWQDNDGNEKRSTDIEVVRCKTLVSHRASSSGELPTEDHNS